MSMTNLQKHALDHAMQLLRDAQTALYRASTKEDAAVKALFSEYGEENYGRQVNSKLQDALVWMQAVSQDKP